MRREVKFQLDVAWFFDSDGGERGTLRNGQSVEWAMERICVAFGGGYYIKHCGGCWKAGENEPMQRDPGATFFVSIEPAAWPVLRSMVGLLSAGQEVAYMVNPDGEEEQVQSAAWPLALTLNEQPEIAEPVVILAQEVEDSLGQDARLNAPLSRARSVVPRGRGIWRTLGALFGWGGL